MLHKLQEWFRQNGVVVNKCELKQISEGNSGLFATEDIEINEEIVKIPKGIIVSAEELLRNKFNKYLKYYPNIFNKDLNDDAEFNCLTLHLLLEKSNKNSIFRDYIEYVRTPSNSLSWNQEKIKSLNDPNFQIVIKKMQIGFQKNFQYFQTFYKEQYDSELQYDLFLWAYQFVMTRCFGGDNHFNSTCLVPFGDMLNHNDKCQTIHKLQGTTSNLDVEPQPQKHLKGQNSQRVEYLIFYAVEKIAKGDEIYNFFGEHSNGFLLCWYGFCYSDNKLDKMYVRVNQQFQIIEQSCYLIENGFSLKRYKLNSSNYLFLNVIQNCSLI